MTTFSALFLLRTHDGKALVEASDRFGVDYQLPRTETIQARDEMLAGFTLRYCSRLQNGTAFYIAEALAPLRADHPLQARGIKLAPDCFGDLSENKGLTALDPVDIDAITELERMVFPSNSIVMPLDWIYSGGRMVFPRD